MLPKLKARTQNYIQFEVQGNAFMEGYLFLTPEPLKLFPYDRENVTLQILDEESNCYTAILHKNYRYIACLGFKNWYQTNRVQDGDEVVLEAIDLEQKKFRLSLIRKIGLKSTGGEIQAGIEKKPRIILRPSQSSVLEYSQQSVGVLRKILNEKLDSPDSFELNQSTVAALAPADFNHLSGLEAMMGVLPLDHQTHLVRKVINDLGGRAILCDEAGLGKNIEALQILMEYYSRHLVKKILVLTPAALAFKWQEELKTKIGLDSVNHFEIEDWSQHDCIVSSMDTAKSTKNREDLQKIDFDIVIIDEAHRLKNPSTKNWKFVNTLSTRFMLFLTASPVHTELVDIYNLVTIVKPGIFKSPSWFRENFVVSNSKKLQLANPEKFRELLSQVIVRTRRADTPLPFPRSEPANEVVPMSHTENEVYQALRNFIWLKIESVPEVVKGSVLNRELFLSLLELGGISLHSLKATINEILKGPVREDLKKGLEDLQKKLLNLKEDTKFERLIKNLGNLSEKGVIFFNDANTLRDVYSALGKRRVHSYMVTQEMRESEKDQIFQTFSRIDRGFLLVDQSSGGGRFFGEVRHIINFDMPWSPIVMEQRLARIYNIRNHQKIIIHNLVWENSIEHTLVEHGYTPIRLFHIIPGELETLMMCIKGRKSLDQIILDTIAFARDAADFTKNFEDLGRYLVKVHQEFEKVVELQNEILG